MPAHPNLQSSSASGPLPRAVAIPIPRYRPSCIGIATSTGGPSALQRILSRLPADFPIPILVVQHIAETFVAGLVRWLGGQCKLQVKIAERGESLAAGKVLFADGRHLVASQGQVRLDDSPPVRGAKPSGTVLFASLAVQFGESAVGFILTGMGDDGCAGLKLLRERGGLTIAQAEAGCAVYGMPRMALETGAAELALPLDEIPLALLQLAEVNRAR
jgi:two-component system chemotaxis response regulator CheB